MWERDQGVKDSGKTGPPELQRSQKPDLSMVAGALNDRCLGSRRPEDLKTDQPISAAVTNGRWGGKLPRVRVHPPLKDSMKFSGPHRRASGRARLASAVPMASPHFGEREPRAPVRRLVE